MVINVSVQYKGGLLPDIILLTQCYYHWGTRFNTMKMFCLRNLMIPPKRFGIFPLIEGCSEGLDAFRFSLKEIAAAITKEVRALDHDSPQTLSPRSSPKSLFCRKHTYLT